MSVSGFILKTLAHICCIFIEIKVFLVMFREETEGSVVTYGLTVLMYVVIGFIYWYHLYGRYIKLI